MTQALVTIVGTVLVWFAAAFLGRPFLKFIDLRREMARASLIALHTPVPIIPSVFGLRMDLTQQEALKKIEDAKVQLRLASIDMIAFGEAEPAAKVLRWIGFDAIATGEAAAAFANLLDGPITTRADYDANLRKLLRIK